MEDVNWEEKAKEALFYISLGKWMAQCVGNLKAEVIKQMMQDEAVSLAAQLYGMLQNPYYDDRGCMERIESILMVYAQQLDLDSLRHIEQD